MILCGDFNIQFLKLDAQASAFCDLANLYGFEQLIFEPTRQLNCIDNILKKNQSKSSIINVIKTPYSDHSAQELSLNVELIQQDNTTFNCRPLTQKGLNVFYNIDDIDDPDEGFRTFQDNISDAFKLAFPEKRIVAKSKTNGVKWFTCNNAR